MPALTAGGMRAVTPNGILGDPRTATAAEGERLLTVLVETLRERLARWTPDERGRLT